MSNEYRICSFVVYSHLPDCIEAKMKVERGKQLQDWNCSEPALLLIIECSEELLFEHGQFSTTCVSTSRKQSRLFDLAIDRTLFRLSYFFSTMNHLSDCPQRGVYLKWCHFETGCFVVCYCSSFHLWLVILEGLHLDPQIVRTKVCWKMLTKMINDHTQNEALQERRAWEDHKYSVLYCLWEKLWAKLFSQCKAICPWTSGALFKAVF